MDSMTGAEVAGIDGIAHSIVAAACRLLGTPVGFLILDGANGSATVPGSVGLAPKKPTSAFRPHLSLAYNNRRRPAAPVVEAVSSLRALPAGDRRRSQ